MLKKILDWWCRNAKKCKLYCLQWRMLIRENGSPYSWVPNPLIHLLITIFKDLTLNNITKNKYGEIKNYKLGNYWAAELAELPLSKISLRSKLESSVTLTRWIECPDGLNFPRIPYRLGFKPLKMVKIKKNKNNSKGNPSVKEKSKNRSEVGS